MKVRSLLVGCMVWLFATGLTVSALGDAGSPQHRHYSFEGVVTHEQRSDYLRLPFQTPEGTTLIKVSYSYRADDDKKAIIDIGIHDPHKFRGWSGSTRSEFTLSESRDLTSDAYIAGEIPAGEWWIELGIVEVAPSSKVGYQVEVALSDEPVGEPFVRPPKKDVVLSREARWYYGDLHCHSTHSDGAYPLDVTLDFAHSQGLDFIATTEHNSISHFSYLGEMQDRYDDMLILYGIEYTSYIGHANVYDYPDIIDFRATRPGYDLNAVIDEIHEGGGYFSPNHPAQFMGIGIPFRIDHINWARVDFYEVVNGRTRVADTAPNPLNLRALRQWDKLLRQGYRITAIGGSDDHHAGRKITNISTPIGTPATVVYAEELSTEKIFEAMKAGHVYILNGGPGDMGIEFTAAGGGSGVMMGDRISADKITYKIKIRNAKFKWLVIVENGFPLALPITSNDFELSFNRKPHSDGYIRLEVKSGVFHEIITNPIYYSPSAD